MLRRGVALQEAQVAGAQGRSIDQPALGVDRLVEVYRQPGHGPQPQPRRQQDDGRHDRPAHPTREHGDIIPHCRR